MSPFGRAGPDAYEILGVAREASDEEVKQAYRALALRHHPDKARGDLSPRQVTQRFQEIQAAYEALAPANRPKYDLENGGFASGRTSLMEACERRDIERVRRILREGADVNETDTTGRTALMFASTAACVETIRVLLEFNADVEARNCAGHSCLFFATGAGLKVDSPEKVEYALRFLETARLLLEEGVPVNAATNYGLTALMLACASGRMNMVDLLLSRGADARATSDVGLTPLVMAADRGHADIVQRLLAAAANVDARHGAGKTPLMGAAALAHTAVVQVLLDARAQVDGVSDDGHTALLYAVERQLKDGLACPVEGPVVKPDAEATVQALLEASADANLAGPHRRAPLHVACAGGSLALIELLVAAGADLDARDEAGQTPALVAKAHAHQEVLWVLRAYGGGEEEVEPEASGAREAYASPGDLWPGAFHSGAPLSGKVASSQARAGGCPMAAAAAATAWRPPEETCMACLRWLWGRP